MVSSLNGHNRRQESSSTFSGKESNGFKAGLGFRRTAYKSCIIVKPVIINKISERKTVTKKQRMEGCAIDRFLILRIESIQFFYIG
jgi:hypothetical protein